MLNVEGVRLELFRRIDHALMVGRIPPNHTAIPSCWIMSWNSTFGTFNGNSMNLKLLCVPRFDGI